ncbi:MAG: 2-(3-amino-3-carboxypropyl)histidine synthase subunit 1/2 [Ignisphaera sp.]
MSICSEHDFKLDLLAQELKKIKARKILMQLPEGFRVCIDLITRKLREYVGEDLEVLYSLNPAYGPCLVDEHSAEEVNADVIIHFGHAEYPFYRPSIRVMFIPVEFQAVDIDKVRSLLNLVCKDNTKVCLVSTSQHIRLCKRLEEISNKCQIVYKGVVYGCTTSDIENCDTLVVVAGGRFNCLSQYLALLKRDHNLTIYCLDPYINILWNPAEEIRKILSVRMWKIYNAFGKRRWLIITGFYGQSRDELTKLLVNKLKERGFEVFVSRVLKIDRELLINLRSSFDVVVIASCPYLAFDFYDLDIPVLTVGEAFMVINGDTSRYIYPW